MRSGWRSHESEGTLRPQFRGCDARGFLSSVTYFLVFGVFRCSLLLPLWSSLSSPFPLHILWSSTTLSRWEPASLAMVVITQQAVNALVGTTELDWTCQC